MKKQDSSNNVTMELLNKTDCKKANENMNLPEVATHSVKSKQSWLSISKRWLFTLICLLFVLFILLIITSILAIYYSNAYHQCSTFDSSQFT